LQTEEERMFSGDRVTTATIRAVFTEEIEAQRGSVSDAFDDGERLFLRSLLPLGEDVAPKDRVQGGVALRSNGSEAWLHPYVYRLVCKNGAIMAQATQTHHVTDLQVLPPEAAVEALREGIRACCVPEAFTAAAQQMRTARETQVDVGLMLLPMLSRFPAGMRNAFQQIIERFAAGGDTSAFGLMNAVTATARDTRDHELRWNLEELGGGIAALRLPRTPSEAPGMRRERREEEVLVG
jgi:hypothetical protein